MFRQPRLKDIPSSLYCNICSQSSYLSAHALNFFYFCMINAYERWTDDPAFREIL